MARLVTKSLLLLGVFIPSLTTPRLAMAHCDTLDGPVVNAAQVALARGDVTPVLVAYTGLKPAAHAGHAGEAGGSASVHP